MSAADLIADVGRALYGARWHSQLAAALDVSDRTLRRWLSGEEAVPQGVWLDLAGFCYKRAVELDQSAGMCSRHMEESR